MLILRVPGGTREQPCRKSVEPYFNPRLERNRRGSGERNFVEGESSIALTFVRRSTDYGFVATVRVIASPPRGS